MQVEKNVQRFFSGIKYAPNLKIDDKHLGVRPPSIRPNSDMSAEILESLIPQARSISMMKSWEWLKGEFGGILLTALGTGLVAPIFIGTNPFVKAPDGATEEQKQDVKNTKWYTAMRQPISAALAILFQISALKPIDMFLDKIFNNDEYAKRWNLHYNHSELNTDSYVKNSAKKELKNAQKTKTPLYKIFTEGWSKVKNERAKYDILLAEKVKEIKDTQLNNLVDSFIETGKIKIGSTHLDNAALADIINGQIESYIKDAEALSYNTKAVAFYADRAETLVNNESKLRDMFKEVPLKEVSELQNRYYFDKYKVKNPNKVELEQIERQLKQLYQKTDVIVRDLYAKETDPKIKKILEEILERPMDMRETRIANTFKRIDRILEACGPEGFSQDAYKKVMTRRNAELVNISSSLENLKFRDLSKVSDDAIKQTIEKLINICKFEKSNKFLKTILHSTDTFGTDLETLKRKVYEDIVKGYKKLINSEYKFHNQITKVAIGVFVTLPITCNALNWVYPRFMEKFFPELAGVKKNKAEGGNK